MNRLLKSDLYKLSKMKSIFICALILIVMGIGLIFLLDFSGTMVQTAVDNGVSIELNGSEEQALQIFTNQTAASLFPSSLGGDGVLFSIIVISIFVACEFGFGTIKNIASRGFSRTKIYLSKLIFSCGVAVFFSLLFCAAYTLTAAGLWGWGDAGPEFWKNAAGLLGLNLLLNCAYASLFTMISSLIRQTGGAIAINFCVMPFAPMLLELLQMAIEKLFHVTMAFQLSSYTLSANMNALTEGALQNDIVLRVLFVGIGFFVVTTIIGLYVFRKRDIK